MIKGVLLKEKFTISVTNTGVLIENDENISLEFSAAEALMLLDILKNEASTLRRMADDASPLPVRIRIQEAVSELPASGSSKKGV